MDDTALLSSTRDSSSTVPFSVRAKEQLGRVGRVVDRCRVCPTKLCGKDSDDIFSFSTPKLVRIRDSRLGVLQLVLQLAILLYVVLFQIVRGTSYLKLAAPTGSLRFSLLEPLLDPTCTTGCVNTLSAKELLPYCATYNGTVKRENLAYPCVFIDGIESQRAAGASMMVTTRITEQAQTRACNENVDNTCPSIWRNENNRSTQFAVQPEAFTLQIDHNVQAVTIGVSVEMRKMKGLLQVGDQRVCCDRVPIKWLAYKGDCRRCGDDASDGFTPQQKELCASLNPDGEKFGATLPPTALCFIKPLRTDVGQGTSSMGIDTFVVGQLVTAAGAQLDQTSFSDSHSQRYNGLQIIANIRYRNSDPWSGLRCKTGLSCPDKGVTYIVSTRALTQGTYKTVDVKTISPTKRVLRNRHGVNFNVVQTGVLGQFDFVTLLLSATTSLTLLAIASTLVHMLASYLMPQRAMYKAFMNETSMDFSTLRDQSRMDTWTRSELERWGVENGFNKFQLEALSNEQEIVKVLHPHWKAHAEELDAAAADIQFDDSHM